MSYPIRLLLSVALLLSLTQPLHAQRTLTGTVQDQQGAAIPFAVIELRSQQLGVQADDKGRFSLPLPAGADSDSLAVSALGYRLMRVVVPAAAGCTLQLAALPVALSEVVVRATAVATQWLGPEKGAERFGFGQSGLSAEKNAGWQIARYFSSAEAGYLTDARFYVKSDGFGDCSKTLYQAPFRVRVYAANGPGGSPGTDLLTRTVLVSAAKPGWVSVDLRPHNIAFPSEGLYVAMEWVYTSDQFFCTYQYTSNTKEKKTATRYGQTLGGRPTAETQTWHLALGREWRKFRVPNTTGKTFIGDAAIQAGFQP